MADYICREAIIDDLEKEIEAGNVALDEDVWINKGLRIAIRDIKDIKSSDVQRVKHGKWEETHISLVKYIPEDEKEEGHLFYMAELKCSCCERYNAVTFALVLNKPDFCQLCGARMDGETSNE